MFYPDNVLLYNKIKEQSLIEPKLIVGKSQNHVYPAYPAPEGKVAIRQIAEIINR